jgi:hypothetical protein
VPKFNEKTLDYSLIALNLGVPFKLAFTDLEHDPILIVGEVDTIQGSTSSDLGDFADLFAFTWGGGAFSVTTI